MIRALRCAAVLLAALWAFGVEEAAAQATVAQVHIITTNRPSVDNTFGRGETIRIEIRWSNGPILPGANATLNVQIGSATRQFACTGGCGGVNHATSWSFEHIVQSNDVDTDGIRVQTLTGTFSRQGGGTVSTTIAGNQVDSANYRVNGAVGAAVTSLALNSPLVGDTYGLDEVIEVTATFSGAVDVAGTPRVRMTGFAGGNGRRDARYVASASTSTSLVFRYTVVAADTASSGISIAATNLRVGTGTTIRASGTTRDAVRTIPAASTVSSSANHKVAGASSRIAVSGVALNAPLQGDTYGLGEVIEATVTFNTAVDVTGTPQLALTVGQNTRQADYDRGHGTTSLVFGYTVIAADADTDGISIAASALTLNSGTITASGVTTAAAPLGLGSNAITNSTLHKVDGQTIRTPTVSALSIESRPRAGVVYGTGEEIEVRLTYRKAVDVTGTPQLALAIGAATRQADYRAAGSTARMLAFSYTVVVGDRDEDGIGVAADALTLNGGSINDASSATTTASLSLAGLFIGNAVGHRVNGQRPDTGGDGGGGSGGPPPSQVTGVRVSPLDGGLRVSWAAATGSVSQYRVDVAAATGELVRRVYAEANVLEAVVDGLANGVDYTVTVTAVPGHGGENGPPSESRTVTPQAGAGDPDDVPGGGEPGEVPVPALPLAGAGLLAALLASAAYRFRSAGRRTPADRRGGR